MKVNTLNLLAIGQKLLLACFTMLCFAQLACAAGPQFQKQVDLLKEANGFFRLAGEQKNPAAAEENYKKALVRFERLVQDGLHSGQLYYNIGNTYFKLNDIGWAILNYRRAEQYIGDDENLRHNLQYVLSLQPDKIELSQDEQIVETLLFWHYDFSVFAKLVLLGVFNTFFWGVLSYKWLVKSSGFRRSLVVSFALVLMMAGSLIYAKSSALKRGVLVSSEVIARKGDSQSYSPSFEEPLHAGLDFVLVDQRNGWLQIELKDGRRCWVPELAAELVDS